MQKRKQRRLTIGDLSKRAGCIVETIRYYERIGMMPEPPRTEGGHRSYDVDHLERLTFIRRGRGLGFTLQEVRDLLRLVDGGDFTCDEVKAFTLDHVAEIGRKIEDLQRLERVLKDMAAQCDLGSVPECPIVEALTHRAA